MGVPAAGSGSILAAIVRAHTGSIAFLALVAGFVVAPRAQAPAQLPQPSFSSSVDIVSVDVNVVDQKGRPVPDLGRDDFLLSVDGRDRKITSAQFLSVARTASASNPPVQAPSFSTNATPAGRMIAVVVDRGSITPVRARDVFAAAARFVRGLDPADHVALYTIPTGAAIDFTTDHRAVEAALQRIDGEGDFQRGPKGIGIAEALAFEKNNSIMMDQALDRECGQVSGRGGLSDVMVCRRMVAEEAAIVSSYAHERARNAINGLRAILERLGSSETPKTLLLVSEGLVVDNERRILEGFGRAAAAAHVTLYALKPEPSENDASQARMPALRSQDRSVREEGLQFVSGAGGGELFRILADPDFEFARVASELSGYYLLGFEPEAGDRDGKSHSISVKVRRAGVLVRSRREFGIGLARAKTDKDAITDLLRMPIQETGIPLTLTTYVFQDPGSLRVRLLVAMDIDRAVAPTGRLSIGLVLLDDKGAVGASLFQPAVPSDTSPIGMQRYFATLLVDPGPYTLRVAVSDEGGRRGSVERPVWAYMRRIAQFRVTELLIGDGRTGEGGTAAIVPSVTGETSANVLHAYLELFSEAPAMFARASVALEVVATPASPALETVAATLQTPDNDDHCRAVSAAVPLSTLPAGAYLARAVISVDGQKVGEVVRPFRIVKSSAN
jgi:VWFA-related protein